MADLLKSFPKIEKMTKLEMLLLFIFIIYLIFPIGTPELIKSFILSPMGYVTIFIVTLYLFFYSHPILAILYVFVAYELLNRSNIAEKQKRQQIQPKQVRFSDKGDESQLKKDAEMVSMNPPAKLTLEEELVNQLAPVGVTVESKYVVTNFQPVSDNIDTASPYV